MVAAVSRDGQRGGTAEGRRRPRLLAGERNLLMARLAAVPDMTLRGLVAALRERGVVTSCGSVWRVVHDAGVSFKNVWPVAFASGMCDLI